MSYQTTTADLDIRDFIDLERYRGQQVTLVVYGFRDPVLVHFYGSKGVKTFGRAEHMDIQVDDGDVSRVHARFIWAKGKLTIEDLGSHNGTWIRNREIKKAVLTSGDTINMGRTWVAVEIMERSDQKSGWGKRAPVVDGQNLVVVNSKMRSIYRQVDKAAKVDAPVLILGESGTGKEHIAQALHRLSSRCRKPFKAINCGAVPRELTESILFGHKKGAFTGAVEKNVGLFEQANGGVLFLDEIGELAVEAQASILRAVETKKITPLGEVKEIAIDVRIVAATHCRVDAMVKEGTFRRDLLYRLNTITFELPPLRDRRDEIQPLAELFLKKTCEAWNKRVVRIDYAVFEAFQRYDWPGNIRQLRNTIERALVSAQGDYIGPEDLPDFFSETELSAQPPISTEPPLSNSSDSNLSYKERLTLWERDLITQAMFRTAGNQTAAARLLRIPIRTFTYKLKSHDLVDKIWESSQQLESRGKNQSNKRLRSRSET